MSIHLLSFPIAAFYVYLMWKADGLESALTLCVPLFALIATLFYADELGSYTGWAGRIPITRTTPGVFIRAFVWLLLVIPSIIIFLQKV